MIHWHTLSFSISSDPHQASRGFSLVELMVTVSIIAILTTASLIVIRSREPAVDRTLQLAVSVIRDAQSRAASGVQYNNSSRCGYGVTPLSLGTGIVLFTSGASSAVDCKTLTRTFDTMKYPTVTTLVFPEVINGTVALQSQGAVFFPDVYFEPPAPTVFVAGASISAGPGRITAGPNGTDCTSNPSECRSACVYTSGRIEIIPGATCP